MANIWKRSEEWVTALRSNLFTWARIKLTVTYVCIILLILGVYSTVLFVGLRRNIRSSTDLNAEQQHHYVEKTIDHIQELITAIDIVMFLFAAVGSYWLAGITLKPIRFFMEAQQAFSADASHELRTPLAVMKTGIEVALRGNEAVPHGIREVLNSNLEEIDFMSTMTDQLLELSRTQNESHPFEPLDISSFVKSMAEKYRPFAMQKNIKITIDRVDPSMILVQKEAIIRIIQNILMNAISYTPDEGSITLAAFQENHKAIVRIEDNGIGISEQDLAHVFERFFKADSSRTGTGSGLGLALTKQLVERNHGQISIHSNLGKGTRVTISFPLI